MTPVPLPGRYPTVPQPAAPAPAARPASSPVSALYQDPAYGAFMRASGLADEVAAADVARRKLGIQQATGLTHEEIEASGKLARENIGGSQEARGVARSGQTQTMLLNQVSAQKRRQDGLDLAAGNELADLQSGLYEGIAGRSLRGAEFGLSTGGDLYKTDGEYEIARRNLGY